MTDKEYVEISRESFMADSAKEFVDVAFLKGKMSDSELKQTYAYFAECYIRYVMMIKELLKQCGGDKTKATLKIMCLIMEESNADFASVAEEWLYNHFSKDVIGFIHDDFMEACGVRRPTEEK
mgnify:FL=1